MRIHDGAPANWRAARAGGGAERSVVAVGNFDGVHRGHQALIKEAVRRARDLDAAAAVLTFEPHPRRVFQPNAEPFLLTCADVKAERIAALGVDHLYRATFDDALFSLTAEDFARDVLTEAVGAAAVVTGADFRFGSRRAGDAGALAQFGAALGFETRAVAPVGDGAEIFSSTAAREALKSARPEEAARILGAWHVISGCVEKGHQRGRTLGFPTANLDFGALLVPAFGVYATQVTVLDGQHVGRYEGTASLGERPTFGGFTANFEVYLHDFEGDLYGARIMVELRHFLRPELKFESVEALIDQMHRDVDLSRNALSQGTAPWLQERSSRTTQ